MLASAPEVTDSSPPLTVTAPVNVFTPVKASRPAPSLSKIPVWLGAFSSTWLTVMSIPVATLIRAPLLVKNAFVSPPKYALLEASGRNVPPSKVKVAVELVPRTVGNAGSVTSAVPPMLMVETLVLPAESNVKLFATKVPPVRLSVELTPVEPALAAPPIARMPTFAVPPV